MKKILIISFCFIAVNLFSQTIDEIRPDTIKHIAKGNDTKLYHGATDYEFETNKDGFNFNKPVTINGQPVSGIDSLYHADTKTYLKNLDTIPKSDSVRQTLTANEGEFDTISAYNNTQILFTDPIVAEDTIFIGSSNNIKIYEINPGINSGVGIAANDGDQIFSSSADIIGMSSKGSGVGVNTVISPPLISFISSSSDYYIRGDTLYMDGSDVVLGVPSVDGNIKAKNLYATDNVEADSGIFDNITSNSQTMGATTVTAFGTSKFIMENTPTDKINTDSLMMLGDTISGHDLLLAVRKILYPNDYVSYLPNDSLYTTPSITLNIPTKVLIPTAEKYSRNWAFFDKGGSDFALQFQSSDSSRFNISATTSVLTSASNVVFELFMYKNGILEEGVASERKIGTGTDVGSISLTGAFDMAENDYIEVFVLIDVSSTVTFTKTSIVIKEDGLID